MIHDRPRPPPPRTRTLHGGSCGCGVLSRSDPRSGDGQRGFRQRRDLRMLAHQRTRSNDFVHLRVVILDVFRKKTEKNTPRQPVASATRWLLAGGGRASIS